MPANPPDGPLAAMREVSHVGMILLRSDLSSEELATWLTSQFKVDVPGIGELAEHGSCAVAWMSPDELLLITPDSAVDSTLFSVQSGLADVHHLAVDVSAMRIVFEICGDKFRDVLAKGTPANVAPESFLAGQMRRSRLGQVQAAFWLRDEETVWIICRRSEAGYLRNWLHSATLEGSAPNYFSF